MIDAILRKQISPWMDKIAPHVTQSGLSANMITFISIGLGLCACFFVALGIYPLAFVFFVAAKMMDGLDGAVARTSPSGETNFGSFLDFAGDFVVYAAFPMFFILGAPEHTMAAVVLLFSYTIMIMMYLFHHLYAVKKAADAPKGGIVENGEMIAFILLSCAAPMAFSALAVLFALMCLATAAMRTIKIIGVLKG